ncbi:MAG TPA: Clp protease ClpP [Ruminococcus sp.]|nr:Clp protease ClpP [Ruminococcus sp.]
MNKFWNWVKNEDTGESELYLNGAIAEETWFGDEVTPAAFKSELKKHTGNITVWINSPGGDCFAASQIYTMLKSHKGKITVKIDGIAASAASVVAMAGDVTLISPTGMLMIHNPATVAAGSKADMEKAIELLEEVKESIINAYETKTSLSRARISHLMDESTWMNAKKAKQLGFVDGILFSGEKQENQDEPDEDTPDEPEKDDEDSLTAMSYSSAATINSLLAKLTSAPVGVPVDQLEKRLELLKY